MPSAVLLSFPRALAIGIALLFALPALSGCLSFDDQATEVQATCEETGRNGRNGDEVERPRTVGAEEDDTVPQRALTGEPIRILTFLGPDDGLREAADLAASQLERAGLSVEVEHVSSSTDPDEIQEQVRASLADRNVAAVIGGVDNETTWTLLEEAVRRNVPVITPLATTPNLTQARPNDGYFFRVPPGDTYDGRALADVAWNAGCRSAVLLVEEGAQNGALAIGFRNGFGSKGGIVNDVLEIPATGDLDRPLDDLRRADPEAVVLALPEDRGADVLQEMASEGITGRSATFLGPRLQTETFSETAGDGAGDEPLAAGLHGATLLRPAEALPDWFTTAVRQETGNPPVPFAAETYDATFATALAAECAGSAVGREVQGALRDVWNRDTGDEYVDGNGVASAILAARSCRADYVGASSMANPDWDARGEPTAAVYHHWRLGQDGMPRTVEPHVLLQA